MGLFSKLFGSEPEPLELPPLGDDGAVLVYTPLTGTVTPVTAMKDAVFVEEILGKGIAVEPKVGRLTAPVDGRISAFYTTKHAICLTTPEGLELLIHIGENTVNLGGRHFTARVKKGDTVKAGQLLMEFDIAAIHKAGYTVTTPVIVIDPDSYDRIELANSTEITEGQVLLRVYPSKTAE
ncbi:MAG: PTS glucose transporter subunit IIA [Angelakisella sp.]